MNNTKKRKNNKTLHPYSIQALIFILVTFVTGFLIRGHGIMTGSVNRAAFGSALWLMSIIHMKQLYLLLFFLLGMPNMNAAGEEPAGEFSAGEVLLQDFHTQRDDIGQHTLTIHISPIPGAGSVTVTPDQSHFDPGDIITITATPAAQGWRFRNWTNQDDEEVSKDSLYTFSMPGHDLELTANFVDINIMKIHDVFALPGDTILVEVELINRMDTVVAFQYSTVLEEGFSYIPGSAKLNPERENGHGIGPSALPTGEL
ncbi:MAG: hypothetical protein EA394_05585, partial [Bacteroidia bacterium]